MKSANKTVTTMMLASCLVAVGCPEAGGGHAHGGHSHGHEHGGHGDHHEHGHAEHGHSHGHSHAAPQTLTVWGEALELYAKHPPLVVGAEVELELYLTWLDGFRPLEHVEVKVTLSGPSELEASASMSSSGVYRVTFTPTVAGTYQGALQITSGGTGSVDGFEVTVFPMNDAAGQAERGDGPVGAIEFKKEQQWRMRFGTAASDRRRVRPSVEVTGDLTTPPGGVAHVHAPVAGRVMAAEAFPRPGTTVEAGELLATIAPTPGNPEDAARASLGVVEAQARLEAARVEVERTRQMVADQAIPERRYEEAQRQERVARAAVRASRRAQSLYSSAQQGAGRGSWRVTSPIGGVIDAVEVSPGEAVGTHDLMFHVVDPRVLWLHVDLPEAWASRFTRDANASFQLVGDDRWHTLDIESAGGASLVHASRTVDELTRTVGVMYALGATDDAFRVGAAVNVLIPVGAPVDSVTVPRSAILEVEGRSVVFVQLTGESFVERAVRTGPSEGDRVAIRAGVAEAERVVTQGAHLLRLAGSSGSLGHGHVH